MNVSQQALLNSIESQGSILNPRYQRKGPEALFVGKQTKIIHNIFIECFIGF